MTKLLTKHDPALRLQSCPEAAGVFRGRLVHWQQDHAGHRYAVPYPTALPALPLIRARRLYLMSAQPPVVNGHFAVCFRHAWKAISPGTRRLLMQYWQAGDPVWTFNGFSPLIEVSEAPWEIEPSADTLGLCTSRGHHLWFRATVVRHMMERPLCALIAHELAHVVELASGLHLGGEATESFADLVMASWGFAPDEFDA